MGRRARTPDPRVHVRRIRSSLRRAWVCLCSQWAETAEDIVWWGRIHRAAPARMCVCRNARSLATDECTCTPSVWACVRAARLRAGFGDLHLWCGSRVFPAVSGGSKWSKVLLVSCLILTPNVCLWGAELRSLVSPIYQRSAWFWARLQKCCTLSKARADVWGPPRNDAPSNQEWPRWFSPAVANEMLWNVEEDVMEWGENVGGKCKIKEKRDCFRQLFGRDFPSSVGSVALMFFSVVLPPCSRKRAPVLRRGLLVCVCVRVCVCWKATQGRCGSPPCLFPPLKPGALMFQHADVGERPAAPVVVPVRLVLPLQSPSAAACQRRAAAGAGTDRALVFKHADLQLRTHVSRINVQGLKFRPEATPPVCLASSGCGGSWTIIELFSIKITEIFQVQSVLIVVVRFQLVASGKSCLTARTVLV